MCYFEENKEVIHLEHLSPKFWIGNQKCVGFHKFKFVYVEKCYPSWMFWIKKCY
jgi:hypothetical protein